MTASQDRRNESGGVQVALLRGINVGGRNRLKMSDLISLFCDLGCKNVRTYIQSGNVLFDADDALVGSLPDLIKESSLERFGFVVPAITRTVAELEAVADHNPFVGQGVDSSTLHVAFLLNRPSLAQIAALEPDRSPADQFVVAGSEIYLHFPNGFARSKLTTQFFDSRLETRCTVRNWRTVLKLLELARPLIR